MAETLDREEADLDILVGLATEDTVAVDDEVLLFINDDSDDDYDLDDTNDAEDII